MKYVLYEAPKRSNELVRIFLYEAPERPNDLVRIVLYEAPERSNDLVLLFYMRPQNGPMTLYVLFYMRPQNRPMTLYILSYMRPPEWSNDLVRIVCTEWFYKRSLANMLPLISTNDIVRVTIRATSRVFSDWRFEDTVAF